MKDDKFSRKWVKVKGSKLKIAHLVNITFAVETVHKIMYTKKLKVIPDYFLMYEKLCCDYWRNKCADFEVKLLERTTDPKQGTEVVVSLTIPDITEESNEITIEDELERPKHLENIHDSKTDRKPEIDEESSQLKIKDEVEPAENNLVCHDDPIGIVRELNGKLPFGKNILQMTVNLSCKMRVHGSSSTIHFKGKEGSQIIECVIICKLIVFVDVYKEKLIIHIENGSYKQYIKLSGEPWGMTIINDTEVSVSYNTSSIEIISINTGRVQNEIRTRNNNNVISYQNGRLFIHLFNSRIVDEINREGDKIRSFSWPLSPGLLSRECLASNKDRLFLTSAFVLYCCHLYGSVIWQFNDHMMRVPIGVTTDGLGSHILVFEIKFNNYPSDLLNIGKKIFTPNFPVLAKTEDDMFRNNYSEGVFILNVTKPGHINIYQLHQQLYATRMTKTAHHIQM
ncbi:unnamed protein product [Mytilus coruscus]|uniref:Uncharacterized protein n=1 Tax=Mytilus coruscus TaxID=42192 RepID=A0A6J8CAB9_MYTCO|nr:unnamed protein product [Mytilus coruscus]